MSAPQQEYDLAGQVIGCAMEVHRELGHGFNENIYKNSLAIELRKQGFGVEIEKKIKVYYKDEIVGDFAADIMVNDELILELKAVVNILPVHEQQLVNYLTATGIEEGLLINFGEPALRFKKKFRTYQPKKSENTKPPRLR